MLEPVRRAIADRTRQLVAGSGRPPGTIGAPGDVGLFGPDSAAWRLHGDISILVGGVRALLLQTMHPLAMAGVADHSDYRRDPLGRLHRTAHFLGRTVYGSSEVAARALAEVRAIHTRVEGTAPDGRRYRADDPHLLAWVHATEVQSFLRANQRYAADPLGPVDADRYVDEMARIGLGLGMTRAPRSVAELDRTLDSYRPELGLNAQGRAAVRFLVAPPLPLAARPAYGLLFGAAVGLLPRWGQWMLRLPLPPLVDPLVFRPAATALIRTLGWALGPPQNRTAATDRVAADA